MADPVDPNDIAMPDNSGIIQVTKEQLVSIAESAAHLSGSVGTSHSTVVNFVQDALGKIPKAAGLATAALLGTSNAATTFANTAGVDSGKLVTFNKQIDQLSEITKRPGTALSTLTNIFSGLKDALGKMGDQSGIAGSLMAKFGGDVAKVIPELLSYMKTIAKAGDEQRVVFAGMLEGARASGAMGPLLERVKTNFEDVGKVVNKQMTVWDNVTKATGLSREEISKYSAIINKVPGFMENMINSHDGVRRSSTVFATTIKLLQVSGRDMNAITQDMTSSIMQLGVSEQGAADYTARLSMAAKNLHIPFDAVRNAINSSATAFKMFATEGAAADEMSKNLEASMTGYIKMLRESGVPMSNAIEMSQHFAGAINEMSIGQKAFLSQQTGGPGGLMGAFQLDKLMDEGKIDQVFGKVQDALRKQFGRIVTTKEAATSQAAAEQMTRQIMILRQGPLGKFANTDAEARKLLESMSNPAGAAEMKKMSTEMTEKKPLDFFLSAGNKIAESSHTVLTDILAAVGKTETASITGASKTTQQFTGRMLSRPGEGTGSPDLMDRLRGTQRAAPVSATSSENLTKDLKNIPETLKLTVSTLGKTISSTKDSSKMGDIQKSIDEFKATATQKLGVNKLVTQEEAGKSEEAARQYAKQVAMLKQGPLGSVVKSDDDAGKLLKFMSSEEVGKGKEAVQPPQFPDVRSGPDYAPPGQRLRQAIKTPAQTEGAPGVAETTAPTGQFRAGGQPVPVTLAPGSTISVNFTGVCPHCGEHVNHNDAAKVNSTAAAAPR